MLQSLQTLVNILYLRQISVRRSHIPSAQQIRVATVLDSTILKNEKLGLIISRVFSITYHVMLLLQLFTVSQLQVPSVDVACWVVRSGCLTITTVATNLSLAISQVCAEVRMRPSNLHQLVTSSTGWVGKWGVAFLSMT